MPMGEDEVVVKVLSQKSETKHRIFAQADVAIIYPRPLREKDCGIVVMADGGSIAT